MMQKYHQCTSQQINETRPHSFQEANAPSMVERGNKGLEQMGEDKGTAWIPKWRKSWVRILTLLVTNTFLEYFATGNLVRRQINADKEESLHEANNKIKCWGVHGHCLGSCRVLLRIFGTLLFQINGEIKLSRVWKKDLGAMFFLFKQMPRYLKLWWCFKGQCLQWIL